MQPLLGLANSSRVARRIVRDEDRAIGVDVGYLTVRNPLADQIAERTVRGVHERQPFALVPPRSGNEHFGSSLVLSRGRQALRMVHPPIGERPSDGSREEQERGHPSDPGTGNRRGGDWSGHGHLGDGRGQKDQVSVADGRAGGNGREAVHCHVIRVNDPLRRLVRRSWLSDEPGFAFVSNRRKFY